MEIRSRFSLFAAIFLLCGASQSHSALIAWYPLNEGSGTVALDASGRGSNLSATGIWLSTGAFGGSMQVGGTVNGTLLARSDYAGSLGGINSATGNKVSISCWLKPDSESIGGNPFYFGDNSVNAGNRIFSAHLEWTDGTTYWDGPWDSGSQRRVSGNLGTVSDALHHYVFSFDGDTGAMTVYKDGILALSGSSAPRASIPWGSIRNFEIGAASFDAWWPGGQVDDFAIFNEILTPAQINAARTVGIAGLVPEPGSVALAVFAGLCLARRRRA